ncbi:hypothetical protein T09_3213 [Trichinella sp. T9]|nr:hypothetical protein T09_3213 [Trichinella sp. T9]
MFSYVNLQCKAMPQMQRGEPDLILWVECDSSFIGQITAFSLKEEKIQRSVFVQSRVEERSATLCKLILSRNCFTNINYGVSFSDMYVVIFNHQLLIHHLSVERKKKTQLLIKTLSLPTIDIKSTVDSVELNPHPELLIADRAEMVQKKEDEEEEVEEEEEDWNCFWINVRFNAVAICSAF